MADGRTVDHRAESPETEDYMTRCLPALSLLCIALAASQPAGAATVQTNSSLLLSERVSIGISQNLVVGAVNLIPAAISPTSSVVLARSVTTMIPTIAPRMGSFTQRLTADVSRGTVQQASFVIVGDSNRSVSISVPDSVALSRLGGNEQVAFNSETSLPLNDLGQSRLGVAPGGGGQLAFGVGGRVQAADNMVAGDYAGILRVTVQYN
jgi:hypothetical protein